MEKNNLIIVVLLVIVVALLACIVAVMPNSNKIDSNVEIMGNDTFNEGDNLQIKLIDVNGSALANQTVNITFSDKDNSNSEYSVTTNDEGIGELKLDKNAGEYNVTVSFDGNDAYNGCNATKKITIEKEVVETENSVSSTSSNGEIDGPEYDSLGISKQQAMRAMQSSGQDVKYDPESGLYVQYDPKYGTYHT